MDTDYTDSIAIKTKSPALTSVNEAQTYEKQRAFMNTVAEEELKEASRHESDFEISRFVEDRAKIVMDLEYRNVEDTIRYIMRELRRNTHDFFEVSAVGKLNC